MKRSSAAKPYRDTSFRQGSTDGRSLGSHLLMLGAGFSRGCDIFSSSCEPLEGVARAFSGSFLTTAKGNPADRVFGLRILRRGLSAGAHTSVRLCNHYCGASRTSGGACETERAARRAPDHDQGPVSRDGNRRDFTGRSSLTMSILSFAFPILIVCPPSTPNEGRSDLPGPAEQRKSICPVASEFSPAAENRTWKR